MDPRAELLREIFQDTVGPVANPSGREEPLMGRIRGWLNRGRYASEIHEGPWGLRFRTAPDAGRTSGLLLIAHLDSTRVDKAPAVDFDRERAAFRFASGRGVGLDDKTGIAAILALSALLRDHPTAGFWVLFTTREEVGQRGALEMPVQWLKEEGVCSALAIDRRSDRFEGGGRRHFVNAYHGVQLDPDERLARPLRAAVAAATGEALSACPSPYCSDALELRGRWDAEIALTDPDLRRRYEATTEAVRRAYAVGRPRMWEQPRSSRYRLMAEVRQSIGHDAGLGVGNLSMDFDEDSTELPVAELLTTIEVLQDLHQRLCRGQGEP